MNVTEWVSHFMGEGPHEPPRCRKLFRQQGRALRFLLVGDIMKDTLNVQVIVVIKFGREVKNAIPSLAFRVDDLNFEVVYLSGLLKFGPDVRADIFVIDKLIQRVFDELILFVSYKVKHGGIHIFENQCLVGRKYSLL
jgi:hypothetical protein